MKTKTLYSNLVGNFTKKGKKLKAKNIISQSLNEVSNSLKVPVYKVYRKLAQKLGNLVELKTVKVKRNIHTVPFPLKPSRRRFLFSKELINGVRKNKQKINTFQKLTYQMNSYLLKKGSNFNRRKQIVKDIVSNRSNIHYRW